MYPHCRRGAGAKDYASHLNSFTHTHIWIHTHIRIHFVGEALQQRIGHYTSHLYPKPLRAQKGSLVEAEEGREREAAGEGGKGWTERGGREGG